MSQEGDGACARRHVDGPYVIALVQKAELGGAALLQVGFEGQVVGQVFYTASDCTGAALGPGKAFIPVLQVIGSTVFRAGADVGPTSITSIESGDQTSGCTSITARGGRCRNVAPGVHSDLAATTVFALLGYTPPFHVAP